MSLLKDFVVLDLSHRLPGPLGGKLFTDLGAKVIKIEDEKFKDPFLSGIFNESDHHFINWYNELNSSKKVFRFSFKADDAKEVMAAQLEKAEFLILAQPKKIRDLLGLEKEELQKKYPNLTVVELIAGDGKFKNLHDLNALALAGLLDMHLESREEDIIHPPFLPVAGISFGHWVTTKALAAKLSKTPWVVASLQEATENVLKPFKSSSAGTPRFLHNGKFPCYCLYKTSDSHALAVAAVEDKFWLRFTELFKLDLSLEERFETSDRVFEIIASVVSKMSSDKIKSLIDGEDICISLV